MIQSISMGLSNDKYVLPEGITRGEKLEELLTVVCNSLGEAGSLTENKADLSFVLSIVGSYLVATKRNELEEGTPPPSVLFNENLFPMLDNYTLEVEDILEAEVVE